MVVHFIQSQLSSNIFLNTNPLAVRTNAVVLGGRHRWVLLTQLYQTKDVTYIMNKNSN